MNTKKNTFFSIVGIFVALVPVLIAHAASVPSFFLAQTNNATQTQVTVLNADPSATVTLYYPVGSVYSTLAIGTTDSNGRLTTTINPTTYNVTSGGASYVMVNGAQSQTQTWPSYTASSQSNSSAGLSLSQSNVTVIAGQSTAIAASVTSGAIGTLSIPSNTNPSVAGAAISGTQVIVNGSTPGSSVLTVCGSSAGCATIYVTVQQAAVSSNTSVPSSSSQTISFNPTSLSLKVGESRTVSLSGSGSYYISSHSRPGTVSNSISGSVLSLTGSLVGTDNISICSSGSNTVSCATLVVTVTAADSTSNTGTSGTITFSSTNLTLTTGQSQVVTVTGSGLGSYYISANSNAEAIGANLSGNTITVTGSKVGGANVTVCQLGGTCGNFYAFVPNGSGATTPSAPASTKPLALTSFSVSSNNVNNVFIGGGTALTVNFSFNQSVSNPSVSIGGLGAPVNGSGSGTYTAIYTLKGTEGSSLPIEIRFGNRVARFTIDGASAASVPEATPAVPPSASTPTFTLYLHSGSTGAQVTALQAKLKALGVYSGPVTGTFGAQTEAAVKKYQAKLGLEQLGAVGPGTRAALNR
ncbi:MAG: putative peptidoglycan-binding protein [Candidatus Parcubacteria bacterium]|nr:putative peptidoglycan-binding protein [Candidatus Parcubacteria bacterium]